MAGDWIKVESTTPDKAEIFRLAELLKIEPDAALGKMVRLWVWFDQHLKNGNAESVTYSLIDKITGTKGFAEGMLCVGWLTSADQGFLIPNFDRHNGKTAKTRALTAKRQAAYKNKTDAIGDDEVTLDASPREEKRREEKEQQIGASGLPILPTNIPYKEIVTLFNDNMGKLPMVRELTLKRRQSIRAAWQATKKRQDLKFWKAYFEECSEDAFLNGTGPYGKGHENWRPSFDYLLKNDVITRVYEKAMSNGT